MDVSISCQKTVKESLVEQLLTVICCLVGHCLRLSF